MRSGIGWAALVFAVAGACWQLGLLVRLWAGRFRYPWDLEWLEGAALYQAFRVMKGLPTFGAPRDGYLPQNHPPLFPVVLAALGKVFGLDYPMARTFSFLCLLGAAALAARAVIMRFGRGPRGWALAALSVGVVAAIPQACMGVTDLVRDDAFAILLCVTAAAQVPLVRRKLKTGRTLSLALTLTAVVYTRLPAVFLAAWVIAFVFFRDRSSGLRLAVVTTALGGLVLVGLLFASHGWYWLLTVGLVQDQHVRVDRIAGGVHVVLSFAPYLPVLPLLTIGLLIARRLSAPSVLWSGLLLASFPASLLPWAKEGGFENDFVPVLFCIGPATAFLMGDLIVALPVRFWISAVLEGALVLAGSGFLACKTWRPELWIPTDDMREAAALVNARVAGMDGGVVAPQHPFLPIRNGHGNPGWSEMPYIDMVWSGYEDLSLGRYVERTGAGYALVTGAEWQITARELGSRYQLDSLVTGPTMVVGSESTIRYVLRANDDEKGGHVVFDFETLRDWSGTPGVFVVAESTPGWQLPIVGAVGRHVADSYARPGADFATGTVVSPLFLIDRPRMSLRVGGSGRPSTRAELRIDGRTERRAVGIWHDQETLTRVVWDVQQFVGKQAQLALVDEDTAVWGHLTCDHVVLY